MTNAITFLAGGLILARALMQLVLARLNRREVQARASTVPAPYREMISPETYQNSVRYSLARNRLEQIEIGWDLLVLGLALFTGILPWSFEQFTHRLGNTPALHAIYLLLVGLALSMIHWPLDWYRQFHLETAFGFNTTTPKLWWLDRGKGLLLTALLGFPLVWGLLHLAEWAGNQWWLWAWGAMVLFQSVLLVLAPVLILPLFNKFTALPEGTLRQRLLELAQRTGFRAASIQVMDGSKRSRHSNAFFTGFGRFRKIVLFDTLLQQLQELELAAVLAHEIGHYKRRHIPKMLIASVLSLLMGFFVLAQLAQTPWFFHAFGFEAPSKSVAFLLFGLLAGVVTFWLSPLTSLWSRRYEYQADAFAAEAMGESSSLIGALRKLSERNLSNLTPHRWYSRFYYSHPTLLEREQALANSTAG